MDTLNYNDSPAKSAIVQKKTGIDNALQIAVTQSIEKNSNLPKLSPQNQATPMTQVNIPSASCEFEA